MELACLWGISVGIWRGLHSCPIGREISPVRADTGLIRFPSAKQRSLTVCLLSQGLPEEAPGGISTYTLTLARGLRDLGCAVHLISRGDAMTSTYSDGMWLHRVHPVPAALVDRGDFPVAAKNLDYSNGVWKKILDIDARWGLDIVESPNWDVEGLLAAMEHRRAVVVRAHSLLSRVMETQDWPESEDLLLCSALEGLLLRHAQAVTGSTQAILDAVDGKVPLNPKRLLIPLGLDIPAGSPPAPHPQGKIVLFVGRLERRKGIHTLLEAIPRVLDAVPQVRFEIAGQDSDAVGRLGWRALWDQAAAAEHRERVRFCGEVSGDELRRLYAACDVFVAPSLYESFGLVYLEAMAHGKPVIGCRTGGVPEVVSDGETGFLVPPEDASALAEATIRLLTEEDLRRRYGEAGRRRYESAFTMETMAARTLELYRRTYAAWNQSCETVWRAEAMDFFRHTDCGVVWIPEIGHTCLLAEAGESRTAAYGPYISLQPGSYRAQFKLFLGSAAKPDARLGSVQVFSKIQQQCSERVFWAADFRAGPGSVLDVFFNVQDPRADDFEFRVLVSGSVPVYIREIVVTRWPHPTLLEALDADQELASCAAAGISDQAMNSSQAG
jgi:glycosyltransferase involved in cell wall biosynthesis